MTKVATPLGVRTLAKLAHYTRHFYLQERESLQKGWEAMFRAQQSTGEFGSGQANWWFKGATTLQESIGVHRHNTPSLFRTC